MKTTRFKAENNYIVNKITNKIIADSDLSKTGLPEEIIRKYNAVGVYTLVELLGIDEDLEEFVISYFNLNDKRNDIYKLILKYLRKCDEETVGGNPSNMTFDYLQRLDRLNSYITDDELEIVKTSLDQTIIDSDMFKQLRKGIIYDLMVTFQIFKWDNNIKVLVYIPPFPILTNCSQTIVKWLYSLIWNIIYRGIKIQILVDKQPCTIRSHNTRISLTHSCNIREMGIIWQSPYKIWIVILNIFWLKIITVFV